MRVEQIGNATLYLSTMEDVIPALDKVDCIFTDPPYLYLKKQAFDKEFDELLFFENVKRLLPDKGFIVLFGRGTSFYRWNTRLADLGFVFKEELIWNKRHLSAPCLAIARIHETISLHTKKTGIIRHSKIPYIEKKQHDINSVFNDIKRIKSAIKKDAQLDNILEFLERGRLLYNVKAVSKYSLTVNASHKKPVYTSEMIMNSIVNGMKEASIIEVLRDHYTMEHPTQKPVCLAERILALISDPGDTIYDPFMGSGSFGVACINTGRKYIGSEMMPEYFDIAVKRIKKAAAQGTFDFGSSNNLAGIDLEGT